MQEVATRLLTYLSPITCDFRMSAGPDGQAHSKVLRHMYLGKVLVAC